MRYELGREKIFTDEKLITKDNIVEVLRKAKGIHDKNANMCDFLLAYEKGEQPLQRIKTYRPEINCEDIDNVANEVSEFKRSFHWGNPITLKQSGNGADKSNAIALLNKCFETDNHHAKTQEIGRFVEICGICNELIELNTNYDEGDSPFVTTILDPRTSFCVYSSYYSDKRKMMGVTYSIVNEETCYTCYTKDIIFTVVGDVVTMEKNPYRVINIVEWLRDYDRMGVFERHIDDMDILNILESDFANDVDQNTQAIWHGNDIEFPKDEEGNVIKPKQGQWLLTNTTLDGKTPLVSPLSIVYDYSGMLSNISFKRNTLLQKMAVPQRNDNSGGSTGIAMSDATGWSQAESVAKKQEPLMAMATLDEVKVALSIIKKSPFVDETNPMLSLVYSDTQANIKRQKTYEMATKINTFATGVSHGISGKHMIETINLFDSANEVWDASKEMIEAYQNSIINKSNEAVGGEGEAAPNADRIMQDKSDQAENSPMIDVSRK